MGEKTLWWDLGSELRIEQNNRFGGLEGATDVVEVGLFRNAFGSILISC